MPPFRELQPGMKNCLFPLAGALALFLPVVARGDFNVVENSLPRAEIVIAAKASEKAKFAAGELQTYLQRISGAKLPIVTDDAKPKDVAILVGPSKLTVGKGLRVPAGLTAARREEGFIVQTSANRLVLAGNDEGPYHGTEYAVYEFLRRLGVRWFMPSEYGEIVPQMTTIAVPELKLAEKPDFVMRNWGVHATPEMKQQEARWKIRNKMNPDAMFKTPTDSSARKLIPEKEYFQDRPELFALKEDKTPNRHMPNLSNPEALALAAATIKDYFRKNPAANSYGFSPDDGMPRDFRPETMKRNAGFTAQGGREGVAGEASISEEWMDFVNAVAAEVRKEFPDVYIAANGYANRDMPPQGRKLDPHLVMMFAAIWSCTLLAYDDQGCWQMVRQGQMLKRWAELSPNVWIYGFHYGMLVSGLAQSITFLPFAEAGTFTRNSRARSVSAYASAAVMCFASSAISDGV